MWKAVEELPFNSSAIKENQRAAAMRLIVPEFPVVATAIVECCLDLTVR